MNLDFAFQNHQWHLSIDGQPDKPSNRLSEMIADILSAAEKPQLADQALRVARHLAIRSGKLPIGFSTTTEEIVELAQLSKDGVALYKL